MNVKILRSSNNILVNGVIRREKAAKLPSMQDGWRFNFNKHALKANSTGYVLTAEETPEIIEGALIFQLINKVEPYMAYVEIAPHNKGNSKKYQYVGGCLIAFAYKLSFTMAEGDYRGYLTFDVQEERPEDERKLMSLYCREYGARLLREGSTTMVIADEPGETLVKEYLER